MSRTVAAPITDLVYPCDVDAVSPDELAEVTAMAAEWLFVLSGGRAGSFITIEDEYRPASGGACGMPYKDSAGAWHNGGAFADGRSCCEIVLYRQPVAVVDAVRVEGVTLDPADYVLEINTLRRLGSCFPTGAGCDVAPVQVDYRWGVPLSPLGRRAVAELACEMLAAIMPLGRDCLLPSGAQQIVRQGITITRPDLSTLLDNGLVGLPVTDAYIRAFNPNRLTQRSKVVQIDGAERAS